MLSGARASRPIAASLLSLALLLSTGCAAPDSAPETNALPPTAGGYPDGPITLIAPANPGGGWDQTARQLQQVLGDTGLLGVPVEVVNRGGAGGTIGLADLVSRHRGNPRTLMVFGQVMLGAVRTNDSPVSVADTVPIARLLNEYEMVAVPVDSSFDSLDALITAFRDTPESISWAGGSAGGIDHMLVGLIALAAGVDPTRVNYVAHAGGGEAAVAVMGGHVSAGVSGVGEWKGFVDTGRMRPLAVSSADRLPGNDTPTFTEHGLDVVLANWRGVLAPPDTAPETRAWLADALDAMRGSPAWQRILSENEWEDSFLSGDDLDRFLADEGETTDRVLRSVGLVR